MAPRFSVMLDKHQLSFDEGSESSSANSSMNSGKKGSLQIEEPKHEKRDSGIAGLEEQPGEIKILEEPKLSLLSPTDAEKKLTQQDSQDSKGEDDEDDDVDTEEGEGPDEEGDSTENEEIVITNIDDELSDEDESNAPPTPGLATPSSKLVIKPKAGSSGLLRDRPATSLSPPTTPTRPQSDFSSLVRTSDHTQSSSATRPLSEHAQFPPKLSRSHPGIASRFRRKDARMEDISQLTCMQQSHDLDITVSPPTPGECGL